MSKPPDQDKIIKRLPLFGYVIDATELLHDCLPNSIPNTRSFNIVGRFWS